MYPLPRSQSVTREEAQPSGNDGVRGRQRQGLGEGPGGPGSRHGRSRSTSRQSRGPGPEVASAPSQRQGRSRSRSMSNQGRHQSQLHRRHGGPSSRDHDDDTSVSRDRKGPRLGPGLGQGKGGEISAGGGGVQTGKDKKPMINAVSDNKRTNNDNNHHSNDDRRRGPSVERGRGREGDRRPIPSEDGMIIRKPPLPSAGRGNGSGSRNRSQNGHGNGSRNGSDSGNGSVNRHHSRDEDRTRSRSVSQSRVAAPGQGLGRRDRSTSRNRTDVGAHGNKVQHSRNSVGTRARRKNDSDTSDDEHLHLPVHSSDQRMKSNLGSNSVIHPSSHIGKGGIHTHAHQPSSSGSSNITATDASRIAQAWRDYASLLSASSVISGAGISTIKEELSPSILSPASLHHRPFSGVIPMNTVGAGTLPTITTETIDALARQLGGKEGIAREEETSILRRAFFTAVNEMKQVVSKAVMCETCEEDTPVKSSVKSPVKSIRSQSNLPVKQLASSVDANNETLYASDFECEDPKDRVQESDDDEHVDDEVVEDMMTSGKGKTYHKGNNNNDNVFKLTTALSEQECDEIVEDDEETNKASSFNKNHGALRRSNNSNATGTNRSNTFGTSEYEVVEDDEDKIVTTRPGQSHLKRSNSPVKSSGAQSNLPVKSTKQSSHLRGSNNGIPSTEIDEEVDDLHQQQQQQQTHKQQQQQQQQQASGTQQSVPEEDDDNDDYDDEVEEESQAHTGGTSVMNSRSGSVSRIPSMLSAASALDTERRPLRLPYPSLSYPALTYIT